MHPATLLTLLSPVLAFAAPLPPGEYVPCYGINCVRPRPNVDPDYLRDDCYGKHQICLPHNEAEIMALIKEKKCHGKKECLELLRKEGREEKVGEKEDEAEKDEDDAPHHRYLHCLGRPMQDCVRKDRAFRLIKLEDEGKCSSQIECEKLLDEEDALLV